MYEEDEHNITVLRKRRRNGARSEDSHSQNGSANGHANGHANGANGHHANGKQSWGWTRTESAFTDADARAEIPHTEHTRRRLGYEDSRSQQEAPKGDAIKLPFDPWRFLAALRRRWYWMIIGAALLGGLGYAVGQKLVRYKVSVNLVRRQVSDPTSANQNDPNRPQISDQTLFAFMRSGDVLRRVAARAATNNPPIHITAGELAKSVNVSPTPLPEVISLSVSGPRRSKELADIANIYAEEVVAYTREMQASESGDVAGYLQQRVILADKDWQAANQELADYQKKSGVINPDKETEALYTEIANYRSRMETARTEAIVYERQIAGLQEALKTQTPKNDRLKTAEEELAMLRIKFKDAHPEVQAQLKKIEALKLQDNSKTSDGLEVPTGGSFGGTLYLQKLEFQNRMEAARQQEKDFGTLYTNAQQKLKGSSTQIAEFANLKAKIQASDETRKFLVKRAAEMKMFVENAMGYYRVFGQASAKDIDWKRRAMKIAALSGAAAAVGFFMSMLLACFVEISDTRLKTISDVERATKLPMLATLGDLEDMSPEEQVGWAFRTLTILRGKLCATPDDALVCGIISSRHGEGRSTWVNLLVSAASQRGLRVLTVDTRPTADGPRTEPRPPQHATRPMKGEAKEKTDASRKGPIVTPPPTTSPVVTQEDQEANDLLSRPMAVAERLKDPESIVHIPIPGWVWSLDRRQQWQEALAQWRAIDNTVILIELPPASCPEAILLAEKIPQLIWLVGSGMADVQETREQLETLRHAHCNVVGSVLNMAPPPAVNSRFTRWFSRFSTMILLGLGLCMGVRAQGQADQPAAQQAPKEQKFAFSGTAEIKRAKWQERLTLGPGDAMDISIQGHPDLTRTNIFVGPDGRISYLQVQSLKVDGMTIEELRAQLDKELAQYYNVARSIVIPIAFNSKKYFVLGKVISKGVYPLDRPMTVIEAVARAQGLETGLYERNTIEMADLSRSFLIRGGQKVDVDFEKLFYEGDLAQNITLEPNDFLFFGAAASKEIYVLGHVMNPGPVGFVPEATVITAITDRGGFTDRAYKGKVLVVRGSLTKPETFIINTKQILDASKPDFRLESRDIVYVSQRPWIRAEELLDEATQSFIQGFVTAFSGVKIGPFIKHPIFGN